MTDGLRLTDGRSDYHNHDSPIEDLQFIIPVGVYELMAYIRDLRYIPPYHKSLTTWRGTHQPCQMFSHIGYGIISIHEWTMTAFKGESGKTSVKRGREGAGERERESEKTWERKRIREISR